jgi:hypothetical protein
MLLKIALIVLTFGTTLFAEHHNGYKHLQCRAVPCDRPSSKRPNPCISSNASASSDNWSGYVAAIGNLNSPTPHTVTKVAGSWVVPNIQPSSGNTNCSIWVGIDGAGSPSVEQLGTEHDWQSGKQLHYAWFEMFPAGSNMIEGFPVEVGDNISASVTYVTLLGILPEGTSLFIMMITNDTKRVYSVIPCFSSVDLQRLCAEWIVEAPWLNSTLPLSNFGNAVMYNCSAVMNSITGPINNPSWLFESMDMVSAQGVVKATTSSLSADGKSFTVGWKHN